ncbi:DUF4343 domain-containing protein [Kitasatospora sp. NPDC001527]|uniref:ATP-grasp domain-containing protein n=1 Tax=Kitasatospora sp. NPDC001527 TaxID=3154519 RepID=UPI00331EC789
MTLLLLAPRINETGLQLLTRARRRGLRAHTPVRWEVPAELAGLRPAHLYGGPLFADIAAGPLGVVPLEPPADWLTALPAELLSRRVECTTLAEARRLRRPAFLKPPADKLFPARVQPDGSGLPGPDALAFAADVLAAGGLPSAAVVAVGRPADGGWAVAEADPAWASGGYACDPDQVLDVVLRAAGPADALTPADRRYARPVPEVVR